MNVNALPAFIGTENFVFLVSQEKVLTQKQKNVNVLKDCDGMAMVVQMFLNVKMERNGISIPIRVSVL